MKQLDYGKLIETEWADQFDDYQLSAIRAGLKAGVNVSHYANPEFDRWQMSEIRDGLVAGLDVVYAIPEFDNFQMAQIRSGLEKD